MVSPLFVVVVHPASAVGDLTKNISQIKPAHNDDVFVLWCLSTVLQGSGRTAIVNEQIEHLESGDVKVFNLHACATAVAFKGRSWGWLAAAAGAVATMSTNWGVVAVRLTQKWSPPVVSPALTCDRAVEVSLSVEPPNCVQFCSLEQCVVNSQKVAELMPHQEHGVRAVIKAFNTRSPQWAWSSDCVGETVACFPGERTTNNAHVCVQIPKCPFRWFHLVDESSMGKTRTVLSFMAQVQQAQQARGGFLVLTSVASIAFWTSEVEKTLGAKQSAGFLRSTVLISRDKWVRRTQKWLNGEVFKTSPKHVKRETESYNPSFHSGFSVMVIDDSALQMQRPLFAVVLKQFLNRNPNTFVVFVDSQMSGTNTWSLISVTSNVDHITSPIVKAQWAASEMELRTLRHKRSIMDMARPSVPRLCMTIIPVSEPEHVVNAVLKCRVKAQCKRALSGVPTKLECSDGTQDEGFNSGEQCPVCMTMPSEPDLLMPCRHQLCHECRLHLRDGKCPICRQVFKVVKHVCSQHSDQCENKLFVCGRGRSEWIHDRGRSDSFKSCAIVCDSCEAVNSGVALLGQGRTAPITGNTTNKRRESLLQSVVDRDNPNILVTTFTTLALSAELPPEVTRVLLWSPPSNRELWKKRVLPRLQGLSSRVSEITVLASLKTHEMEETVGLV